MKKNYNMENATIQYNNQIVFNILATGSVIPEINEPEYALYMGTNWGNIPCKIGTREECEDKLTEKLLELELAPSETNVQKLARELASENFTKSMG